MPMGCANAFAVGGRKSYAEASMRWPQQELEITEGPVRFSVLFECCGNVRIRTEQSDEALSHTETTTMPIEA